MTGTGKASETIHLAIAERMVSDWSSGSLKPLASYESMFRGFEQAVWEEYQRVRNTLGDSDHAAPAQAPGAPEDEATQGARFGEFQTLRELGRGAQGVVYLARDQKLGREVALKVLTNLASLDGAALARFLREAELASRLDHPAICTVYSSGVQDDVPFIAMRHVDGPSLRAMLSSWHGEFEGAVHRPAAPAVSPPAALTASPRTREGIDAIVDLFARIADALAVAHAAGVVHRDIKPGNLMVTAAGEPVVLDFGLARNTGEDVQTLTATGSTLGTPAYIPPEQLSGRADTVDGRWDTYSLGVTLYECLSGAHPFASATLDRLYQAILDGRPVPLRRRNPRIPADLAVVVETAMDPDPNRRYRSAALLAQDLRRVLAHEPIHARPAGPLLLARRFVQRNPRFAAALALLALSLATGFALVASERARLQVKTEEYERLQQLERAREKLTQSGPELWQLNERGRELKLAWLEEARGLVAELPELRRSLAELRARGRLATTQEKRLAPENRTLHRTLLALESRLRGLRAQEEVLAGLAAAPSAAGYDEADIARSLAAARGARERTEAELEHQSARLDVARWNFDDPAATDREDNLEKLVGRIEAITADRPGRVCIPAVAANLRLSERVDQVTLVDAADAWRRAAAAVAADPRFAWVEGGFALRPQRGLVPLGPDADSGLEEFAVYGSGNIPTRDTSGRLLRTETMALVLVLLPGGASVSLGPTPADAAAKLDNEWSRTVQLTPFFLGKFEVTQHQWLQVMGENPASRRPGYVDAGHTFTAQHPVETVPFVACDEFVRRLDMTMPTEAQWEFAARAGTRGRFAFADGKLEGRCNIAGQELAGRVQKKIVATWTDGFALTAPVGHFQPNGFGLHDMHGNLQEWCRDVYVKVPPPVDPVPGDGLVPTAHPDAAEHRAVRGGCWHSNPVDARLAHRTHHAGHDGTSALGVRVALPCPDR